MNNNKYIECNTIERFNEVTQIIVVFEDSRTGGEYSRTGTTQIYSEPLEFPFYFPIEEKWFELFEVGEMIDEVPQPEIEGDEDDTEIS